MNPRHVLLVLSFVAAFVWSAAVPAAASCIMLPGSLEQRLKDAEIVFVGTVDSADDSGRIANVVVESVWKGQVDEHVQVQGGPGDPQAMTSVDRGFDVGTRYLFVPTKGNGQVFEDNACTDTRQWKAKFAQHAPEDAAAVDGPPSTADPQAEEAANEGGPAADPAAQPQPEAQPQASNLSWLWITAAVALAVVAVVAVVLRRRGQPTPTA